MFVQQTGLSFIPEQPQSEVSMPPHRHHPAPLMSPLCHIVSHCTVNMRSLSVWTWQNIKYSNILYKLLLETCPLLLLSFISARSWINITWSSVEKEVKQDSITLFFHSSIRKPSHVEPNGLLIAFPTRPSVYRLHYEHKLNKTKKSKHAYIITKRREALSWLNQRIHMRWALCPEWPTPQKQDDELQRL